MVIGPAFKILMLLSVLVGIAAWTYSRRAEGRLNTLKAWVEHARKERWEALSPAQKALPAAGMMRLRLDGMSDDRDFEERFQAWRHAQRVFFGCLLLAALLAGTAIVIQFV